MSVTPSDMLRYVLEENLDQEFLLAIMNQQGGYSIAEIADKKIFHRDGLCRLTSESYGITVPIEDENVAAADAAGRLVSAFISRNEQGRQVHFLVHRIPKAEKERYEEEITEDVVRYMILTTILALRLDSKEKIRTYLGR